MYPGNSRNVCDHPALFLTNNHAILKCFLASYSTVVYIPDKKETHTVAFSNFLENNKRFSYFVYTDL